MVFAIGIQLGETVESEYFFFLLRNDEIRNAIILNIWIGLFINGEFLSTYWVWTFIFSGLFLGLWNLIGVNVWKEQCGLWEVSLITIGD